MNPTAGRRAALLAALSLLSASPSRAQPQSVAPSRRAALTLDALLQRFRAVPGLSARFREERHMELLAAPLVSEGTLHFAPPGRMVRRTERPSRAVALIEGGRLQVRDEGGAQSIDLAAHPAVGQLVESVLSVLAGDRAALDRSYLMEFRALEGARWSLTLRPRSAGLSRLLRGVSLTGDGVILSTFTVNESNGDVSRTTFLDVDPTRRFSPAEAARVFRLAP